MLMVAIPCAFAAACAYGAATAVEHIAANGTDTHVATNDTHVATNATRRHGATEATRPHGATDDGGSHDATDHPGPHGATDLNGPHHATDHPGPHGATDLNGPHHATDRPSRPNVATERIGPRGLHDLVRDPRWLAGVGLDVIAALLQTVALATGPVVLVQPCLVLALPVSLLIAWRLGAHRPTGGQYRACGLIFAGLGAFFLAIGDPGDADPLRLLPTIATAAVLAFGGTLTLSAANRWSSRSRATAYGLVAGACAGFAAVLLDATAAAWHVNGRGALADPDALVAAALLVPSAVAGLVLLQFAFRTEPLGASYPADLTANPVTAVVLGALLLHEEIPHSPIDVIVFAVCLTVVALGTFRLAAHRPATAT